MVRDLAEKTGVHRTTVARWIAKKKLPESVYALLDLTQNGSLARIHSAWDGWKLCPHTGEILPPNDARGFTPGHLLAMQLRYQELSALRIQMTELKSRLRQLEKPARGRTLGVVSQ